MLSSLKCQIIVRVLSVAFFTLMPFCEIVRFGVKPELLISSNCHKFAGSELIFQGVTAIPLAMLFTETIQI